MALSHDVGRLYMPKKKEDEPFSIKEFKKEHKQKEKEMKNIKENQTVRTILTVFLTLLGIAVIATAFVGGMNYQKSINSEVSSQVKDVVSKIKVETSKTNQ